MCPIVPIFTCGLFRSNFSFAIVPRSLLGLRDPSVIQKRRVKPFQFVIPTHDFQSLLQMERGTGLEPATICLEGRDSTTELPPLIPTLIPAARYSVEPGTGIEPVTSS